MSTTIVVRGPLLTGASGPIVEEYRRRMTAAVADAGDARVEILHRAFFREPTPIYWEKVVAKPREDYHVVTDGGVVYGPWLEGTGSRNRTTRFKGYWSFRTTTQSLRANAHVIVAPIVRDLVRELGD